MPAQAKTRPPRQGPRPLPLHLMVQGSMLLGSLPALPASKSGLLPWKPHLAEAAKALAADLHRSDDQAVVAAVDEEIRHRLDEFLRGLTAYRQHRWHRALPEVPVVWQSGTTRLLDYGTGGTGPVVLLVPSLINRAYVLDLTAKRSLARYLAERGLRPLLVDWDAPGEAERRFTLTDYIAGRLAAALDVAVAANGDQAVPVVGYCMGGMLALALAVLRPAQVAGLALLATPWDFHADGLRQACLLRGLAEPLGQLIDSQGGLPVDLLQAMFSTIDPLANGKKFRAFAALDPRSAKARDFVAVEDWANDGVPLAAAVARECLFGWYVDNDPACGRWQVGGVPIRPEAVGQPCLSLVPAKDRIVPPGSALALAEALPQGFTKTLSAGHIGMISGKGAKTEVYGPLSKWIGRFA